MKARTWLSWNEPGRDSVRLWLLAVILGAGGCHGDSPAPADRAPAGSLSADLISAAQAVPAPADVTQLAPLLAEFNRGAALMEQYRYGDAATAFEKVLQAQPDWLAAKFNLALAYLNLQGQREQKESMDLAREKFEEVLRADPKHIASQFCLGVYYQYLGDSEKALDYFAAAHQADPLDPHATYKHAETLLTLGREAEGLPLLEQLVQRDPGFISGVYRLATQYMRAKQREKALPLFERFRQLQAAELAGGSHTVQTAYAAAGKYYCLLGADNLPLPPTAVPGRRIVFSPDVKQLEASPQRWNWSGGAVQLPGLGVADVDADGDLDLCLSGLSPEGQTSLFRNDGQGRFSAGEPLATRGVSPGFGDVDNDGDCDLWLGRSGADLLLTNDGQGHFQPAEAGGWEGPEALTHLARLADLDNDGDLDLLAFRLAQGDVPAAANQVAAAGSVFHSHRDGAFSDMAEKLGLQSAQTAPAALICDDFDNDYDLDLILFPAAGPPLVWVNDRVGGYHLVDAGAAGLNAAGVVSGTTGDPDKDGDRDLLLCTAAGMTLLRNDGHFRFTADERFSAGAGRPGATGGQFADLDNDGDLDIVVADGQRRDGSRGPALLINQWPQPGFVDAAEADPGLLLAAIKTDGPASCVVADFTGDGRCDLFLAAAGKPPLLLENATAGGHWISLDLAGTRPQDNKSRSNRSAIGARVEVKTGPVYQQYTVGGASGPVASLPLRVHAGLGDQTQVDWLRVIWPDAVLQAELELAADRLTPIEELNRKTSSCPYLFAWDGARFEFIADFGGVGGLGYLLAPGVYARPDPTEYLRVDRLQPRDGQYVLQAITPLEEVTYFDEAKLLAIDHPLDTEVLPHELMAVGVEPPPFELFCFRRPIEPLRAVDHRGQDVTEALRAVDRRCAGATQPDHRFLGLAEEHRVELDFADRLAAVPADGRLILVLHGWVEYGYSSTNYAASQAGLRAQAPTIEVWRDGRWTPLLREVGYPAGVNHWMTVDLSGRMLPGDRRLRISSNMELYWDRMFLAVHDPAAPLEIKEVAAHSADLHFYGYPREYSPDGQRPNLCDYQNVERTAGWKLMAGQYTRYGQVRELLDAADDRFVIMGHGEELTLRFPADAYGPVPDGCRRTFVLKTDSYCKDMDLYTAHPDTLEPLPFHGMSGYPYPAAEKYPDDPQTRAYRQQYNTRTVLGRR